MGRRFKTFVALATVALLVLVTVDPHHHHGRLLCLVVEMCHTDHVFNDSHTAHHSSTDDNDCLLRKGAGPVVKSSDGFAKSHPSFAPQFCGLAGTVVSLSRPEETVVRISAPCLPDGSAYHCSPASLRAPPVF